MFTAVNKYLLSMLFLPYIDSTYSQENFKHRFSEEVWLAERLWFIIVILPLFYSFKFYFHHSLCVYQGSLSWNTMHLSYGKIRDSICWDKIFAADDKLPHSYWPSNTHSLSHSFCGSGVRIRLNWVACLGSQWSSNKVSAALNSHVEAWVGEESMFKARLLAGFISLAAVKLKIQVSSGWQKPSSAPRGYLQFLKAATVVLCAVPPLILTSSRQQRESLESNLLAKWSLLIIQPNSGSEILSPFPHCID